MAFRARYHDGKLHPMGNHGAAIAADLMDDGDIVLVEIDHPRSQATHRHQFAELRELWTHLPESVQDAPWASTPETARKHALIVMGYRHSAAIDCGSDAAARRVGPALLAEAERGHGYAIVSVRGPVVTLYTPESQSMRAMGMKRFQESKTAVLDWLSEQIGARDVV